MKLRHHAMVTLMAVVPALGIAPAFAAKPEPTLQAPPSGPPVEIPIGSMTGTTTQCNLGVLGPAAHAYAYVFPPGDAYYTLINPAACADCQVDDRLLTMVHMQLRFPVACEIPVTVSIVPAVDLGGGCFAPDLGPTLVCAPVQYMVSDEGVLNQCRDYPLALDSGCFIDRPVFLKIEFGQGTCTQGRPNFCGPAACSNCTQYNFWPGAEGLDDLCARYSVSSIMYVESTSCAPTSTAPGSWGRLKTLYR